LASQPKTDEGESKSEERLKELAGEITGLRDSIANNQLTALNEKIGELQTQIKSGKEDSLKETIERLEDQVAEAKEMAGKQPTVTGRTEMDAVVALGEKALEVAREGGRNVTALLGAPRTRQQFDPGRKGAAERRKEGERAARSVEQEAKIAGQEDQFLTGSQEVNE